jgi:hypothetical protein
MESKETIQLLLMILGITAIFLFTIFIITAISQPKIEKKAFFKKRKQIDMKLQKQIEIIEQLIAATEGLNWLVKEEWSKDIENGKKLLKHLNQKKTNRYGTSERSRKTNKSNSKHTPRG